MVRDGTVLRTSVENVAAKNAWTSDTSAHDGFVLHGRSNEKGVGDEAVGDGGVGHGVVSDGRMRVKDTGGTAAVMGFSCTTGSAVPMLLEQAYGCLTRLTWEEGYVLLKALCTCIHKTFIFSAIVFQFDWRNLK